MLWNIKPNGHGQAKTENDTHLRRNQLIMRHTVFLVWEVNQGVILFFCEFCKISKNNFFTEHLQATASVKIETQVKIMT